MTLAQLEAWLATLRTTHTLHLGFSRRQYWARLSVSVGRHDLRVASGTGGSLEAALTALYEDAMDMAKMA